MGPIAVFDSGVGGLTVAREIMRQIPNERIVYFGDTARVPYGSKSKDNIIKFSRQIIRFLQTENVKAIVIACNTASALALDEMQQEFELPILGVVKPGAKVAVETTANKRIGLIGTEANIRSGVYTRYIKSLDDEAKVFEKACPLFVPLVEEGWLHDDITLQVASRYLEELKEKDIDKYQSITDLINEKLKEKEASMLKRVLYLPEYAKDIRSSGMKQTVLERYRKNTEEKADLIRKQGGKIGRLTALETIGGSCLLIDFFASLYLAVKTLVWNTMTASGFVAVLNACNQIQFSLESLSAQLSVFAENGTLIERFRTVENMEPEIEKKEPGQLAAPFETLQVQDICFQYENNKFGLKNVRFEIKKGEKVAFVGENGSGKTTLVKLLLRLYDCCSGEILYNGMPAEKMNIRTYRSAYSTLFQDFNLYAASVAENVSMNQNPDLEKVRDALICARIPKAADQLDGIISKEFCADGIDFSGGERQRIALARVFYENHDILIMDEPTAAMDIRFEKEFYDLVFSYLKDKTILMISHRLASITACDRIFYMENGSITEQGTHQELMEKQGKYAKLFLAQLN